jgi:hypothetical protein
MKVIKKVVCIGFMMLSYVSSYGAYYGIDDVSSFENSFEKRIEESKI